ncbi:hypothetical protein [Paraburkholderia sp. J7]|uniref:hypothetical protein n=1 Tax=Paraburkholderia sp. J7 TaxID=2805438 RepID=UPI002AB614E0|nr:hypothetical protein [Paraburkholderia sp. J7]
MQIAQESAGRREPVDALLNKQFDRPPVIDTKLAILAFDTITDTHSRPENESRLLGFLTGVCYASDIPLGELASKKP